MTRIRLIASDLDGTLLRNGSQVLREDTCGLITQLKEKGILFMACSGRQYDSLQSLFAPVKDDIFYLCQNGSSAVANGTLLFEEKMKKETADRLVDDVAERDTTEIMLGAWHCGYIRADRESFFRVMEDVHTHVEGVPDLHAYTDRCSRITLYEEDGVRDLSYWQKQYGADFTVVTGGRQWVDMMPCNVNKGTGMRQILSHLAIPSEEILVLGDNLNDLEVMRMAGLTATVPTGVPEIRKLADTVVNTVEDMLEEIIAGKDRIEDWKKH